jgi:tRNA(fMet)-specific endonuclease VapC
LTALLDTDVAIHLRDGDAAIKARIGALASPPALSVVTWVELEGGIHAVPAFARKRRAAVDALLETLEILDFDSACAAAYGRIVAAAGYSRPKVVDRMIAATALVHGLTLITANGKDFADVPGLALEVWRMP